uniref:Ribosomal protein S19 n=1 Tax=Vischeria stellata TaxID=1104407 RepID=A0A481XFD0_9STRA|nr:ribosomal protein S19 [Vischeria stellata]QBK36835.1 ribosomal protein S19 [Vischeria stellata]
MIFKQPKYIPLVLLRKYTKLKLSKFYLRSCPINLLMTNIQLKVYNGKDFVILPLFKNMINFKVGEFVLTRVRNEYKKKRKKKRKK